MPSRRPALGALVLALAGHSTAAPPAACTPQPVREVEEIFLSADCERCWQQGDAAAAAPRTLRLDWIVPGRQGDEAPLAAAALPEAGARLKGQLTADTGSVQRQRLPAAPSGTRLSVQSGLAWNGYIGLSFELERVGALPAGARGWVALVERVAAGDDGTPVARQLVRTLVGPLPLQPPRGQRRLQHLQAVLLPPNSRAERLAAVGWVERADGRMLLAAQSPAAGCAPP